MIKVIVNADDFGLDENRTKAILQAYQEGWISTTTAIVTTDWFAKAVELSVGSRLHRNIGLHLNLTEGHPLSQTIRKSPLFCNPDGSFNACFHNSIFHRLYLPSFEVKAVMEEVNAQLERYCQSGLSCFHLDSHHHVHTDLSIARIVLPLAVKAGFKTVRLSRNLGESLSSIKKLYKCFINSRLNSYKNLSQNVDYFCNFNDLCKNIDDLPNDCTVEVMTHPIYSRDGAPELSGELTEFHWDCGRIRDFCRHLPDNLQLVDYEGTL